MPQVPDGGSFFEKKNRSGVILIHFVLEEIKTSL